MPPMRALWLPCCCALLTACAASEPPPRVVTQIQVERIAPPAGLLQCLSDPEPPAEPDQRAVALYLSDLWEAWADCAGKVDAMRRLYGAR